VPTDTISTADIAPTTSEQVRASTTTSSTATSSTSATSPSLPTTPEPTDECAVVSMLAVVDAAIADARLAAGGEWSSDTTGVRFDERTHPAEEMRYRMGFDCSIRAAQRTPSGAERLLLATWTGDRRAFVVQATDAPSEPYAQNVNFQLMTETAYGEWLDDQFVWAGTMQGGESIVIGAVDTSVGLAAKSWQAAVPRFEDLPVTIDEERYAIEALIAAGARNVSVAEPAGEDWKIASIQHITPLGLHLIATVATPDWFDPAAKLFPGETTVERVAGVEVYVTRGEPDAYAVGSVGWSCGEYVWFLDSVWGSVEELLDWAAAIIEAAPCAAAREVG
jgi:hypothetical protein